ncbi:MAG TPA: hypothetical protein PKC87_01350 [Candidatus Absconditabacterales bacterium]|nr:hypothetical protein [Candidatus Absconditabacterales bacterium]
MKKIKITFELEVDALKAALTDVGNNMGYTLRELQNEDLLKLETELNSDIENHFVHNLVEFLEEGLEQDCYIEFFEDEDE